MMNNIKLARGDNNGLSTSDTDQVEETKISQESTNKTCTETGESYPSTKLNNHDISAQEVDGNEEELKQRIAHCRSIIESLKHELHEEKLKMEKIKPRQETFQPSCCSMINDNKLCSNKHEHNQLQETNSYSACLSSTFNCDENLIAYEKQLQRYQNTLNMAQIEKKNAIRKQMLSKAFNLKLLEVENQCNIELLRVKQSLQCLEPLRMIANNWKTATDNSYDLNSFELIPRFPELNFDTLTDLSKTVDDLEVKEGAEKYEIESGNKENSVD